MFCYWRSVFCVLVRTRIRVCFLVCVCVCVCVCVSLSVSVSLLDAMGLFTQHGRTYQCLLCAWLCLCVHATRSLSNLTGSPCSLNVLPTCPPPACPDSLLPHLPWFPHVSSAPVPRMAGVIWALDSRLLPRRLRKSKDRNSLTSRPL